MIEVVAGVQAAVAEVLERASMQLVRPRVGYDADLAAGSLPVFSAIAVLDQVEFPHRIHSQHLAARAIGPARLARGVRAEVLYPVDRVLIFFRPPAHHRKEVALESHIRSVIDGAGGDGEKLIEAASVQRQLLDLLLGDQSGGRGHSRVHQRSSLSHGDLLHDTSHL